MATGNPFSYCDTEMQVLRALASSVRSEYPRAFADLAAERLKEIRAVGDLYKSVVDSQKEHEPQREPKAQGAIIEIIETNPLPDGHPGVMKPNEIRINGIPVLVPADGGIEIENLEYNIGELSKEALIVKLRLYARRIVIGEAL